MLKIIVMAISLVFMIAINALAVLLPLNGIQTAAVSDKYLNFFTPAGYVFSIWSLIYVALIAHLIYIIVKRKSLSSYIENIFPWYVLSSVANAFWMFAWHYEVMWLTVVIMLILLGSLIKLIGYELKGNKASFFISAPVSLYLGWISVATVANISAFLVSLNLITDHTLPIAMVMYVVAGSLGIIALWLKRNYIYAGVIVWALIGIASKFSWVEGILYTCLMVAATIVVTGIVKALRK